MESTTLGQLSQHAAVSGSEMIPTSSTLSLTIQGVIGEQTGTLVDKGQHLSCHFKHQGVWAAMRLGASDSKLAHDSEVC